MIKVIVGYKVKNIGELEPILVKIRAHAMQYPGFVSSENLISTKDSSVIAMISTWDRIQDWEIWQESSIRNNLINEAAQVLEEDPRITVYKVMPTDRWR